MIEDVDGYTVVLLSFLSTSLRPTLYKECTLLFIHRDKFDQRSIPRVCVSPGPDTASPQTTCQLASLSVFMPACRVSARLFQTFHPHHLPADWSVCRPKSPSAQKAQWSLFWVAKLSGLTAPIGPTSLPDRGECLDRQILAAMCEKRCVCIVSERTRMYTDAHTPSGSLRVYRDALF